MKTFLLFLLCSMPCLAKNWDINKDHSEILFEISYLKVSEVTGRFSKFEGQVEYDEKSQNFKSVDLLIDAQSIDTGNKMRDGHLKSNDFLKTSIYPSMSFKSSSISRLSPKHYRSQGSLIIRNITKMTVLDFTTSDLVKDTWGFQNIFVEFAAKINRQDFQMVWNKTLPQSEYLVGDVVSIHGNLQLQPFGEKTPTTKHMIPDTQSIREREMALRGETQLPATGAVSPTSPIARATVSRTEVPEPTVVQVSKEKSFTWWFSLAILGMLGFLASITVGTKAKQYIAATYHKKYVESGVLGNLSDLVVVIVMLIYAMAFWYVGWGL